MLFITHDLELASAICDRVLVMYAGRIMEEQPTEGLFAWPSSPVHRRPARGPPGSTPPPVRLAVIPGRPPTPVDAPPGCPFHPRCSYVEDACTIQIPPLRRVAPGALSACRRTDEIRRAAAEGGRTPEPQPALLAVEELEKTFHVRRAFSRARTEVHALRRVSFRLEQGEALGIVGESGSGKTTIAPCSSGSSRRPGAGCS